MNAIIQKLIPLADAHQAADEYIAGQTKWDGKGACAIGCTCYDATMLGILPEGSYYDHAALAEATGTHPRLWHLADAIFEGLPEEERTAWTPRFLRAASQCDDTHRAVWRLLAWLLGPDSPSAQGNAHPAVADAVAGVRLLCERSAAGEKVPSTEWSASRSAAESARSAAWSKIANQLILCLQGTKQRDRQC